MIKVIFSSRLASIVVLIVSLLGCGPESDSGPEGSALNIAPTFCNNNEAGVPSGILIAWDMPIEYSDNSPLYFSDIEGFRIYYGTEPKRYNRVISIDTPEMTSCSIPVSSTDTYYITMTVVTKEGLESKYSNEIFRTI